jgi:hypothetical protein
MLRRAWVFGDASMHDAVPLPAARVQGLFTPGGFVQTFQEKQDSKAQLTTNKEQVGTRKRRRQTGAEGRAIYTSNRVGDRGRRTAWLGKLSLLTPLFTLLVFDWLFSASAHLKPCTSVSHPSASRCLSRTTPT